MPHLLEEREILIVGAGVAGLALAIRLKENGLHPLVIEKQVGVRHQLKGEFFQPKGVELLSKLNLLDLFSLSETHPIGQICHVHSHPVFRTTANFTSEYSHYKAGTHGMICLHENVLKAMRTKYLGLGGELREGVHIADLDVLQSSNICTLSNGDVIKSKLFVGADGRYSLTRKMAEMPTIDMDCDRVMMATLMSDVKIPMGVFYTEEISGGVLYAFRYKSGLSRVYVCFLKEELQKATARREHFFREKIEKTRLFMNQEITLADPILFMPTIDTMMLNRSKHQAVWIGDAAGVVDPLAGYGLTLSLQDAIEISDAILDSISKPEGLDKAINDFSMAAQKRYLHARYLGLWVALLFMGTNSAGRIAKWRTLNQVDKNFELRHRLIALFSGFDTDPFQLHDIPYYLGILPNLIHGTIDQISLIRKMGVLQNYILTTPFEMKKSALKTKVQSVIEKLLQA